MKDSQIAQQTLAEHQMLKYLIEGLRTTIDWPVSGNDCSRKLSTVRFIAQSFQRHLERMMTLEEFEGYMDLVTESAPSLRKAVAGLRQDHDRFRESARRVVQRLERASADNPTALTAICDEILTLLRQLDEHSKMEVGLLQEALTRDTGGEG
jgi:hemerythrin-like domain-containing protein